MGALDSLLDRIPVTEAVRFDLRRRLHAPDRHYHGATHVGLLWERHQRFRCGLALPAEPWDTLIACAIAFHDAVYEARRRDNEMASVLLWRGAGAAVGAAESDWVAGTIAATADHLAAQPEPGMTAQAWAARLWMLDLDLTPIGDAGKEFAANTVLLRREFAHLEDAAWDQGRLDFLRRLAASPRLFRSEALAAAFEAQARSNIAGELSMSRDR